jgi:hypothetical protein
MTSKTLKGNNLHRIVFSLTNLKDQSIPYKMDQEHILLSPFIE